MEQKTRSELVGTRESFEATGLDIDGFPITSDEADTWGLSVQKKTCTKKYQSLDRFNY